MPERSNSARENSNDDRQAVKFRTLFIGGLDYESTEETIKKHFEQWGEITKCVVRRNPVTKKSRGFCFLTYKTAEMLDDAQKNRPHKVDDQEVDTKRAMPRDGSNSNQSSVNKLFVGGLKEEDSEDDLREVFGHFGKIDNLEMITDKTTGKQKGFCFITFDDFDSVDKCVLKRRITLNGKKVEMKKAFPKDRDGGMGSGRGGRGGMRGRGGFGGNNNGTNNNGYGNMGGGDGLNGYGSHQGYGGGNQGGYAYFGAMGGGPGGGDYYSAYNFGLGYGSGLTNGAGFAQRGAGHYGSGYGMGGYLG